MQGKYDGHSCPSISAPARSFVIEPAVAMLERDSVLECGGKPWRDTAFRRPDSRLRPNNVQHPAKAVTEMQACALHLCHRTQRRCRAHVNARNERR